MRSLKTTPLEFAQVHVGYNCSDTVSLINDPRHPYEQVYTVERLGNVVGGRSVRYLNLPAQTLKDVAIKMLQADYPVWFGCDGACPSSLPLLALLADSERARSRQIERYEERHHGPEALRLRRCVRHPQDQNGQASPHASGRLEHDPVRLFPPILTTRLADCTLLFARSCL